MAVNPEMSKVRGHVSLWPRLSERLWLNREVFPCFSRRHHRAWLVQTKSQQIDDFEVWSQAELLLNIGLADINAVAQPGPVARVLPSVLGRIVHSVHVLITLHRTHDMKVYQHDSCAVLRSCYDVYVQAAFILLDQTSAEEKAQDYLDFYHIERHLLMQKVSKSNLPFKDKILNSPLRARNEPLLLRDFNRVAPRFKTKSGEFRKNWYKGDLRALADTCGIVDEYDFVLSRLHSSVHSSAFALFGGGGVPYRHIPFFAMRLVFRLLGLLAKHYGITFSSSEVREAVDAFDGHFFAMPRSSFAGKVR
jgi:hypothetical protein